MKALTLHQPWASLIADGRKRYETRSWRLSIPRGALLAIHAGRTCDWQATVEFYGSLYAPGAGIVLCVAQYVRAIRTDDADHFGITDEERGYGDWSPGRWAWELDVVERLDPPIGARVRQGLWDWDRAAIRGTS